MTMMSRRTITPIKADVRTPEDQVMRKSVSMSNDGSVVRGSGCLPGGRRLSTTTPDGGHQQGPARRDDQAPKLYLSNRVPSRAVSGPPAVIFRADGGASGQRCAEHWGRGGGDGFHASRRWNGAIGQEMPW